MKQDSPRFRAALLHSIEQERSKKLTDFNEVLKDNELTYLKFAFKTEERQENPNIKQFQKTNNFQRTGICLLILGMMNICDLWSTTQINRYLDISRFTKDKFLLQKLVKQNNKLTKLHKPSPLKHRESDVKITQKRDLGQIIKELNQLQKENLSLKTKLNRRIYCKTVQY